MPMPLVRRTRCDSDLREITPTAFFHEDFPALAERNGGMVAEAMSELGAWPLTVEVEDEIWTIEHAGDTIAAKAGPAENPLRVVLTAKQFSDCMQNQMSLNGMMVARQLRFADTELWQVSLWDSLLLTLLDGWPTVAPELSFLDRAGRPLDLGRTFGPDDNPAEIAHFLRETGYLHLRGWLDPADMAMISADMDRASGSYREGDGMSWWATLANGERACVRMQHFDRFSPTTERLLNGETWEKLRATIAADDPVIVPPSETRLVEALFKPLGVVSGPSDLSFHRDCHLGRHMYECSHITIGISLTSSGRENGLLQVIAGSHRVAMPVEIAKTAPNLPVIEIETRPGDLTVHLSCTLHASTPPKIEPRRVLYTPFALAGTDKMHGDELGNLREQVTELERGEHEDSHAGQ